MNKKLNAYSSVILIIVIFLLALSLVFVSIVINQSIALNRSTQDSIQSKYIAESYLNLFLSQLDDEDELIAAKKDITVNLFPEYDHQVNLEIFPENLYLKEQAKKILLTSEYKKIKSSAEAYISSYNKIFFLENNQVRAENLEEKNKKYLEIFKDKINQGILFEQNFPVYEFFQGDILFKDYKDNYFVGQLVEGKLVKTGEFIDKNPMIIKEEVGIMSTNERNEFILSGILYLEGSLILNSDFAFSGIIISNGGKIISNNHNVRLMGKLVELDSQGSYADLNIENLNDSELNMYLEKLQAAKLKEIINIKINNEITK